MGTRKSLACLGLFLAVGLVIVGVGQWNILRPAAEPTDPVQRSATGGTDMEPEEEEEESCCVGAVSFLTRLAAPAAERWT